MRGAERAGAPTLGNAVGLFVALWAVSYFEWMTPEGGLDEITFGLMVASAGTICTHVLIEIRGLMSWIGDLFK